MILIVLDLRVIVLLWYLGSGGEIQGEGEGDSIVIKNEPERIETNRNRWMAIKVISAAHVRRHHTHPVSR